MNPTTTTTTGLTGYYPEMGEKQPEGTQIEAQLSHYGKHWYIRCAPSVPVLKGRGIEDMGVQTEAQLVPGSKFVGWHKYKVTEKAFQVICAKYKVSSESLL
jgi:hypothetical protein